MVQAEESIHKLSIERGWPIGDMEVAETGWNLGLGRSGGGKRMLSCLSRIP